MYSNSRQDIDMSNLFFKVILQVIMLLEVEEVS